MSVEVLSTVETICTTNPQPIEVIELQDKVDRLVVNSHDSSIAVQRCRQQTRPSTTTMNFVDNAMDLTWRNFLSPEFGTEFQRDVP